MKHPSDFAICISSYLTKHLAGTRNLSSNTIKSYRDTFCLLLLFMKEMNKKIDRDQSVLELLHQSHRANTAAPYLVFHIFSSGLEVKAALSTPVPAGIPQTSFLFLSSELQEYAGNAAAFLGFGTAHTEKTHGSQLTAHSSSKHYSRGLLPANPKSEYPVKAAPQKPLTARLFPALLRNIRA